MTDRAELQDPRTISLDGATQNLLSQVSNAIDNLDALRPFGQDVAERLRTALLPDRVVASLNMEHIRATRRQTIPIMDAMRIDESADRSEREIFNVLLADEFITDLVERGVLLSAAEIREVNRLVLTDLHDEAGRFREANVELPGAPFIPPHHGDIPEMVRGLCDLFPLGDSRPAVVQAAWLHAQFTLIHPFSDGNGRTGRLLQDYALIKRGHLPVGIPPAQRDDYYSALEAADVGNWDPLVEMIALLELDLISKTEAIAREPQERASWIEQLSKAASSQRTNTRHRHYLVFRQQEQGVASGFEQAAVDLDSTSDVIGATYREYGIVDFAKWQEICDRGSADRTWLFSLLFFAEGRPLYKSIFYLARHRPMPADTFSRRRDLVGLFVTGLEAASTERPRFGDYDDPHIRLREILFVDNALFVYSEQTREPNEPRGRVSDWTCSTDTGLGQLVQGFFEDVFVRKAGIGL
jgi:Fic family protein